MKTLKLNQMEVLTAGSDRQCMLAGAGIVGTGVAGFFMPAAWIATAVIIISNADCL